MMYADFKLVPHKSFNLLLLVKSVTPSLKITSISGITVSSEIGSSISTVKVLLFLINAENFGIPNALKCTSCLWSPTHSYAIKDFSLISFLKPHSINSGKFISTFRFIVGITIQPPHIHHLTLHHSLSASSLLVTTLYQMNRSYYQYLS